MPRHDEGFFSAKDNLRLFWESDLPDSPKADIVIVHGYGEHVGRYRRTIDALVKLGYAVHAFDYRGHGQADGRRGHVDSFSEYLEDLKLFWERARQAAQGRKMFLLAHSHGALMSILWLKNEQPDDVRAVVLSAPYLKLAMTPPPLKVFGAKLVGKVIPWLPISTGLGFTDLTRNLEVQRETENDPLYSRKATPRWFTEALAAQAEAIAAAPKITLPTFVLAGSADPIASTPVARKFFEQLGAPDKKFKEYVGMLHEPLNENGKEEVVADIASWISSHL